jgi:hypothetical protein
MDHVSFLFPLTEWTLPIACLHEILHVLTRLINTDPATTSTVMEVLRYACLRECLKH